MSELENKYGEVFAAAAYNARLDNYRGALNDLEEGLNDTCGLFASAGLALLKPHLEAAHLTGRPLFPLPVPRCRSGQNFLRMFQEAYDKA